MNLELISPQKVYFSGEVQLVTLPGKSGKFTLLNNHAPLISVLDKGEISYRTLSNDFTLHIEGGFAEVNNNIVRICVEKAE